MCWKALKQWSKTITKKRMRETSAQMITAPGYAAFAIVSVCKSADANPPSLLADLGSIVPSVCCRHTNKAVVRFWMQYHSAMIWRFKRKGYEDTVFDASSQMAAATRRTAGVLTMQMTLEEWSFDRGFHGVWA
jgi:hypothetical protein